jgi:hypothetical protein
MSAANKAEYHTSEAVLYGSIAMLPTPGRMLFVRVYEGQAGESVVWEPVVGLLVYTRTRYYKPFPGGHPSDPYPPPPAGHEELVRAGYQADPPELAIQPVYQDPIYGFIEAGNAVARGPDEVHRTVVACDWPPGEDRENVIRLVKEQKVEIYDPGRRATLSAPESAEPGTVAALEDLLDHLDGIIAATTDRLVLIDLQWLRTGLDRVIATTEQFADREGP